MCYTKNGITSCRSARILWIRHLSNPPRVLCNQHPTLPHCSTRCPTLTFNFPRIDLEQAAKVYFQEKQLLTRPSEKKTVRPFSFLGLWYPFVAPLNYPTAVYIAGVQLAADNQLPFLGTTLPFVLFNRISAIFLPESSLLKSFRLLEVKLLDSWCCILTLACSAFPGPFVISLLVS